MFDIFEVFSEKLVIIVINISTVCCSVTLNSINHMTLPLDVAWCSCCYRFYACLSSSGAVPEDVRLTGMKDERSSERFSTRASR